MAPSDLRLPNAEIMNVKQDMIKREEAQLCEFMATCHQSAQVLPEYMCQDFGKRLVKQKKVYIFMGKEVYSNTAIGFSLHKWVSNFWQHRIKFKKRIQTAGIFEWWNRFIDMKYMISAQDRGTTNDQLKPAMKGNVLLIFILLLFGLSIKFN